LLRARRLFGSIAVASLLTTAIAAPLASAAQPTFTQRNMEGSDLFVTDENTDFWINAVSPADIDGDGDLDLAVIGFYVVYFESVEEILVVFHNEGPAESGGWSFTEQRVPLGDVTAGASDLAWGDYDNDGDPDLAVGSDGATVLYRNDGGTLVLAPTSPSDLPGYDEDSSYSGAYDLRSVTWADVDNDADLDLLIPSVLDPDTFEYSTRLLRNDGDDGLGAWTFTDTGAAIDPTLHAQSAWADDDGDEDLDLFLTNIDVYTETGFVKRFENTDTGFAGEDLLGIKVEYGLADWGDYDADGDLDILVAGNIQEEDETFDTVLRTYRNDGGTFTPTTWADDNGGDWLDIHAATWADYDSDGDMDMLVTGSFVHPTESKIVGKSEIYGNEGGTFTPLGVQLPAPISSIGRGGAFTWFDLDNDLDLDYLVAGAYYVPDGNGLVEAQINLYENEADESNAGPTAPSGLDVGGTADGLALDWAPASDDSTPQDALTYDVEVRRAGGDFGPAKRDPAPGTLGAVEDWEITGLEPGRYVWSVRAVDSAFNAGPRAQGTFKVKAATAGLTVTARPIDPPIVVPATGGSFEYRVHVQNTTGTWKAFELSILLTKPGGTPRIVSRLTGSVAAGQTFHATLVQNVPARFPAGQYTQTVSLQPTPTPETSDSFTWVKQPPAGG
jgi:FG-GAP-like repeat